VKTLDKGVYQIVITKQSHKEQTVMVNVNDGEMNVLDIKLEEVAFGYPLDL
jgi:hypothetical protein